MPYGYNGKILHVDLSSSTLSVEEPPEEFYRTYMGGSGLNLHYLLKEMAPGADPLGPENILALSVGVTTGAPVSGQSRMTANAKSPLTGAIGDSQCGGFLPAEMKFAGFDAIIIRGKAPSPVYLWIRDGKAEIRDASHLWGKLTGEAEEAIRKELGDSKIEVVQIGPAGEKGVRFAALINMSCRANGRTGMGAVMGSKNLRAVAVRGTARPPLADRKALNDLARWGAKTFPESYVVGLGKYGTAETTGKQQAVGGLPSYNFTRGVFDGWKAIDGTTMYDTVLRGREKGEQDRYGRDTCFGCVIRCKRVVEIKEGPFQVDPHYGGPEYETTSTFGNYCGNDNLAAIAKANELCNKYGMDTISCGATIAWAMETFEAGELTLEDTGGLELRFGNAEALVKLVEMIGKREGFGDVLAEGSARAAERLGRGRDFLITSKGQEAPAHMPQVKRSLALIYAVNPFGADHQSSEHDPAYEDEYEYYADRLGALGLTKPQKPQSLGPEKVEFALKTEYFYSMMDSLNLCQFACGPAWQLYGPEEVVKMVRAVTGWDVTVDELQKVGERRLNMLRAFNAREGINRNQDRLPEKFFKRPLKGGPSDGFKVERDQFEAALEEYYRQAGWDVKTGTPTRQTLERLGLGWVADELKV
ncbi:MAG: aldehyde ferredoxin oxidoreductase family protein [Deltaproteobacteria bacterium]|nr:aldehyde ferredoxin oxidoreductase family protein [Deltaproteobacteria bacterium]